MTHAEQVLWEWEGPYYGEAARYRLVSRQGREPCVQVFERDEWRNRYEGSVLGESAIPEMVKMALKIDGLLDELDNAKAELRECWEEADIR